MRIGLLFRREIDSIQSPADESRIFVKSFSQNLRRPALRGHHRDLHVRIVVIFRARCRFESNVLLGDHCGLVSGPGVLTIFFTSPSLSVTTYRSAVSEEIRSVSLCALNAMRVPSGDHENSATLNLSPSVSRFGSAAGAPPPGTSVVQRCIIW